MNNNDNRNFVYEKVTRQILDDMIRGDLPWRRVRLQRKGESPQFYNPITKTSYTPLNTMLLGKPGMYATLKQINSKGGHIKKGSKGKMVVFWDTYIPKKYKEEAERLEAEGKSTEHLRVVNLKYYTVFNIEDDTEGIILKGVEKMPDTAPAEVPTYVADNVLSDYCRNENVTFTQDDRLDPGYHPATDSVDMPTKKMYYIEEDWYADAFGEMVHSTAKASRCNRQKEFDALCAGEDSVKEELIAEIGSSMILSTVGMHRTETKDQISAKCKRWIKAMNNDFRLIVHAAGKAEKAARYILGALAE